MISSAIIMLSHAVVVIGFENTTYNTLENNTESVIVCASVRPLPSPQLAKSVEVVLSSADGTAMGRSCSYCSY